MITILVDFEAYPGGARRAFRAGEIVSDLTKEDAALYVAKGVAVPAKQEKKREAE